MNNSIKYSGNVTIKVKNRKPSRVHNSGTTALFSLLCNILSRSIDLNMPTLFSESLPCYMSMINDQDGKITSETLSENIDYSAYLNAVLLREELIITSRNADSDGSIVFSSLLSNSQTLQSAKTSYKNCYYVLLLDNKKKILAHAAFEPSTIDDVFTDVTGQAVIEWTMMFSNQE